jgi:2-aminoethylphosphonate transport system substrate-binding protein
MKTVLFGAALTAAALLVTPVWAASDVVTIYSADGLHDG